MAGDWIKVEAVLPDKPEVWQIAEALNMDPDTVVGKLIRVWRWFDQHTENGNAPSVTKKLIDREVGVTGFIDALCVVHWMSEKNGFLQVINFDRHNSKSAKNRALTHSRVKRKRNADTVTNALPEKRREEVISTNVDINKGAPKKRGAPGLARNDFFEFARKHDAMTEAEDYEAVLKKKKTVNSDRAWNQRLKTLQDLHARGSPVKAVLGRSADSGWTGLFEVKNGNGSAQHGTRETAVQRSERIEREKLAALGYPNR